MSKLRYLLLQLRTTLWVKPALTGILAVAYVEVAYVAGYSYNWNPSIRIDRDLLFNLLQILASSMLTVAIFAVSAMVAAFSSVATTATPRATRIVMQDRSAQNALAAFLSAFIYAIVAMVALSALSYGGTGRLFLFGGYVFIIGWVLISFIRWVDQVSRLGRMHDTIHRVEEVCLTAFTDDQIARSLGALPLQGESNCGVKIFPKTIGYVQHIDLEALQEVADQASTKLSILARHGAFVDRHRALACLDVEEILDDEVLEEITDAFSIGDERYVEADPRCGLLTLAEIADRALSPAVNDPGTAIHVISAQLRLITRWAETLQSTSEPIYPSLLVRELSADDLLDDAFSPIARDAAGLYEVGVKLQKTFRAIQLLGHEGLTEAAALQSRLALEQALPKMPTEYHREKLQELASKLATPDPAHTK